MASVRRTKIFNSSSQVAEGWYWAIESRAVGRGKVAAARVLGRDLAIYRGADGVAQAVDAYCPHMGAHLAEGHVDGNSLRCFFHNWKFERDGRLSDVPCLDRAPQTSLKTWPTRERYGLIWVWTGDEPTSELPYAPELHDTEVDSVLGNRFVKNCHPNVVMINAIDEHHFNTVHNLPVDLHMATQPVSRRVQTFENETRVPKKNRLTRAIGRFYDGPLTYKLCYHFGTNGTVTLGPDAFHFHILFALRLIDGGKTEGQTILLTNKRHGLAGKLTSSVALRLTRIVGNYFAQGDTQVFQTMKFDFKTPTRADHAIIDFVKHVEAQPAVTFGSWAPVDAEQADVVRLEVVHG